MAGTTEQLAAITARCTLLAGRERWKCVYCVAGVPTRHCVLAGMAGGTRDGVAESSCLAVCSIGTECYVAEYPISVPAMANLSASTSPKHCMADYPTPVLKCSASTARHYLAKLTTATAPAVWRWLQQLLLGWPVAAMEG